MEAKIDAILLAVAPDTGDKTIDTIDRTYEGRHTDTGYKHKLSETVRTSS